jgi:hypothetical protein
MKNPLAIVADVALRYLGTYETSKNRGPHIAEFWEKTNYKEGDDNREPWCCAFTVFCIQTADDESPNFKLRVPPKMAGCRDFMLWAMKPENGCVVFTPDSELYKPRKGDIVCYLKGENFDRGLSHIGIMALDYVHDGFIRIAEGNTNKEGAREGDGVYSKQRRYDFAGYFVRLPVMAKLATSELT